MTAGARGRPSEPSPLRRWLAPPFTAFIFLIHPLLAIYRPGAESSIEKVLGSETDQRLQELAMDVSGPHGLLCGDFGQAWLYSRSETIMGGTSEIQRNVIATRILGLPR